MSVYLNISKPFYTDDWSVTEPNSPDFVKSYEKKGYDGIIFENDGEIEYIVFSPTQIKSATDNNGEFDPKNKDITE